MFKKSSSYQPGGLIRFFRLSDWYTTLSPEQQSKVKYYYSLGINTDPKNLDTGNISSTSNSQKFLYPIGMNATSHKDYPIAEIVLLKALESVDGNPIDLHFVYDSLINLYYKQREDRPDALSRCVDFCLRDINSIEQFIDLWNQESKSLGNPDDKIETPRIPSFERLAIIYDKQGGFSEAIKICKKAIELNLHDSTKGGFPARIALLEKKMDKEIS